MNEIVETNQHWDRGGAIITERRCCEIEWKRSRAKERRGESTKAGERGS